MDSHVADVWFRVTDLEVVSGAGAVVTASDGTEYLDFTSGIGVVNTGHCHPDVVAAIREQAGRFIHAQVNVYRHPLLEQLGARLDDVTPDGIERFFYANSGAEAVEGAVKLARQVTGRPHLIVFQGSFHGRTAQTMAMTTSKIGYRAGHAPSPAGVFVAPFPNPFSTGETETAAVDRCLAELDLVLATQTAPGETAAMVIEPVLGEGGYLPAAPGFLAGIAERCRAHGILFVLDEIQTGFGRTGRFFNCEDQGVTPDVLIMAKGLASGFPISAVGSSAELMQRWPTGSHGGTYGGNPIGLRRRARDDRRDRRAGVPRRCPREGCAAHVGVARRRGGTPCARRRPRARAHGRMRDRRCRGSARCRAGRGRDASLPRARPGVVHDRWVVRERRPLDPTAHRHRRAARCRGRRVLRRPRRDPRHLNSSFTSAPRREPSSEHRRWGACVGERGGRRTW